jgi:GTPase Era involved in 16S rRNA processing
MLKRLFTSNARIKLLRLFLLNPDEEHFIRQLTRDLDEQINSIRRELDNLKKMGLLKARAKLRKKYYYVNKNYIFYNELRSIFQKSESSIPEIAEKIASFGNLKVLVFSGIFIDKDSPVDLLIVGQIDREKLTNYLNNELPSKRAVKFTVMSEEDFGYRLKCKDKFVVDLVSDKENIIPLKKLDIQ